MYDDIDMTEVEDRAYCYTILFDEPVAESTHLRFTIEELADSRKPAQISEISVATAGTSKDIKSNSNFLTPSIYSAENAGLLNKKLFAIDNGAAYNSQYIRCKSPYVYDYAMSASDLIGTNANTDIGSYWHGSTAANGNATGVRIEKNSSGRMWYMVDMDVVGQRINKIQIMPRNSTLTGYIVKSSNDKGVWENPDSDKWNTLVEGTCKKTNTTNDKDDVRQNISIPNATRARYWMVEMYGIDGTSGSFSCYPLYLYEVTDVDTTNISKAAVEALEKGGTPNNSLPTNSGTYTLTWKIGEETITNFSYDTDAKDITITAKSGDVSNTFTKKNAIPAEGVVLDGDAGANKQLTYVAALNDIEIATAKVYFAGYDEDGNLEFVYVRSLEADGYSFSAKCTLPNSYAADTGIKAFLWNGTTFAPLTTTVLEK